MQNLLIDTRKSTYSMICTIHKKKEKTAAITALNYFGKHAYFLVNKLDAEMLIGTQKNIFQFFNYLYIRSLPL